MFSKILVPLDGSLLAETALRPAATIAKALEAELLLVQVPVTQMVLHDPVLGHGIVWPEDANRKLVQEAEEYLADVEKRPFLAPLSVTTIIEEGEAASTVVKIAEEAEVDLIIMSTHGYSGVTRWLLGSVTEKVLRHAPCPVLALRGEAELNQMLITLDDSEWSEAVLAPAAAVAQALKADVTLLEVANPFEQIDPYELAAISKIERGIAEQLIRGYYNAAEEHLDQVKHSHLFTGLTVKTAALRGNPAENILHYLDTHDVALVAMATHGRGGLRRWVYGSVTEKVLRGGNKSMLIVRPD